jgi:hypothetical protein
MSDMSDYETRLAQLEKKLQDITDREQILACVVNNARGCDRHDVDLLSSSYHADGIDEHGAAQINQGSEYSDWANMVHSKGSIQNLHHITNHSCTIEGDVAHAESYVIGLFFNADGHTARLLSGRYVDRLERRDGQWRIALRRCTVEVGLNADATVMNSSYFRDMGFLKGLRNQDDVAYQRPLSLDETPDGHRWPAVQS